MKLFDEVPYCNGGRVVLKKLENTDAAGLRELTESVRVYRYLPAFLYEKNNGSMEHVISTLYTECIKESIILGIYADGDFCGLAEFYGYRDQLHKVSVGYRLLERHWGKGIATETLRLMLKYLQENTDIEIITASTMVENRASANVLIKNGFELVSSGVGEDWGFPEPTLTDKWIL